MIQHKIVRIVLTLSQLIQPSPRQNPLIPAEPHLALIVQKDEKRMIMLTLNENVDADIMIKGIN